MKVALTHPWTLSPAEARDLQQALRAQVVVSPLPAEIALVAGVDAGFVAGSIRAAIVVLSYPALELLEVQTASEPVSFPYVPGLLSFREAPAILHAAERLALEPDVILVDGHGYAHPRRFGIASHLGVVLDKPTIGCAKSRLIGEHAFPDTEHGARSALSHDGEVIGAVVRTNAGSKPIYLSVGHKADLESAVALALSATRRHRLPEPTRQAHLAAAGRLKRA